MENITLELKGERQLVLTKLTDNRLEVQIYDAKGELEEDDRMRSDMLAKIIFE